MKSSKKECYFAGAYTRLSQDDGDKAESDSIRNQKELIRNFQKSHSEIHIVEEYEELTIDSKSFGLMSWINSENYELSFYFFSF